MTAILLINQLTLISTFHAHKMLFTNCCKLAEEVNSIERAIQFTNAYVHPGTEYFQCELGANALWAVCQAIKFITTYATEANLRQHSPEQRTPSQTAENWSSRAVQRFYHAPNDHAIATTTTTPTNTNTTKTTTIISNPHHTSTPLTYPKTR